MSPCLTFSDGAYGELASLVIGEFLYDPTTARWTRFGGIGSIVAKNTTRVVGIWSGPAALTTNRFK